MSIVLGHMGDMCLHIEWWTVRREDEAMNAGRQYLFLDKCHDLFYAATGTRD